MAAFASASAFAVGPEVALDLVAAVGSGMAYSAGNWSPDWGAAGSAVVRTPRQVLPVQTAEAVSTVESGLWPLEVPTAMEVVPAVLDTPDIAEREV